MWNKNVSIDWNNPDLNIDEIIWIEDLDKKEGFYIETDVIDIIKWFNLDDFYLLEKNIDYNKWVYELLYNWKVIARWNFVLWEFDILIKYVEKFTDTKWFWTLMYIDFLAKLKNKWIRIIKSEIKSPEVVSIYGKLINRWIISDTFNWYFIN